MKTDKFISISKYLREVLEYQIIKDREDLLTNKVFDLALLGHTDERLELLIVDSDSSRVVALVPIPDKIEDLLQALTLLKIQL